MYCRKVVREKGIVKQQIQVAVFLRELLFVRDDRLVLSNNVSLTREEIETFIDELCTNQMCISNLQSCVIVLIVCTFVHASCTIS